MKKANASFNTAKFLTALVVMTALLCACILFTACNHTHDYTRTVTVQPTCTSKGTATYLCECGDSYDEDIDAVAHDVYYASDDYYHWKECKNCSYTAEKSMHAYTVDMTDKNVPSTCVKAGYEVKACVCGKEKQYEQPLAEHQLGAYVVESGSHYRKCANCDYETYHSPHSYTKELIEKYVAPTCTENGVKVYACVCNDEREVTQYAAHELSYVKTNDGHYAKCSKCDYQGEVEEHEFKTDVPSKSQAPTCQTEGYQTKVCVCGEESRTAIPTISHNYSKYVVDEDNGAYHWLACSACLSKKENTKALHQTEGSEVYEEGDCQTPEYVTCYCKLCNDYIRYQGTSYGKHNPVLHEAKEATDYTDGNRRYWECTVEGCGRYFTGAGCDDRDELTWEEIFRPRLITVVESYDELIDKLNDWDMESPSSYFQLEIKDNVDVLVGAIDWMPNGDDLIKIIFASGDVSVIDKNDVLTVKFRVSNESTVGYDWTFVDAAIINVQSASDEVALKISCKFEGNITEYVYINVVNQDDKSYFSDGTEVVQPKAFSKNDKIVFECAAYNGAILKSLIINGKSYALTNGVTEEITVTENITAEFVFSKYNLMIVNISPIDTSLSGAQVDADAYVTYTYTGGTNDYGRLYHNSLTEFTVNNANISQIVIEYEDYELTAVAQNVIKAGKDKEHADKVTYAISDEKTTITFTSGDISYFSYNATEKQARIQSIKIYYTTNNTFAE